MLDWLQHYQSWIGGLSLLSIVIFIGTLFFVPWIVVRIPVDYFSYRRKERMALVVRSRGLRILLRILRNLAGIFFVILGMILIVLPGPGLLTILLGVTLMNFPGKERVLLWVVSRKTVSTSINWIREKNGKPPLCIDSVHFPEKVTSQKKASKEKE